MNINLSENIDYFLDFFWDSKEGLIVLDSDENICFINNSAENLFGNIATIADIGHYFSFDVCILQDTDIATYNPITAAMTAKEPFKAQALYQIAEDQYKSIYIRSFYFNAYKLILISDISPENENIELRKQNNLYSEQILELEKDNQEFSKLRERAEAQAIRMSLINKISRSIRDTLDIDEIIQTAIGEISKTLGVYKGIYAEFNKETFVISHQWGINNTVNSGNLQIDTDKDNLVKEILKTPKSQTDLSYEISASELKPRLVTPVVYQGTILGIMAFYHPNSKKTWHPEEISLVDGISDQVAAAIYQASLFEELENQKAELEQTLKQLKNAQTQLIQSEKMASLGKLVAGIAHEINTPIGALNSNTDVLVKYAGKLREKTQDNPEYSSLFSMLDDINIVNMEAIRRINGIIKSLKNFARLDEAELKEVDIHEGIRSSLMLINHEIKNRINIVEEFDNLPLIECYPNLLNQVIMNLLVNAYQSIEGQGTIKIKTQMRYNIVEITISDTGKGISPENLEKIFDPGFTTKGVGVGTGLGLSICYQIVDKHRGKIRVDSEPDKGTAFTVELPLKQNPNC